MMHCLQIEAPDGIAKAFRKTEIRPRDKMSYLIGVNLKTTHQDEEAISDVKVEL